LDTKPYLDQVKVYKEGLRLDQTFNSSKYSDSSLLALRELFSSLNLNSENTLLDVGCGKGIVLMAASEFGLKKIKGFDHSHFLCEIAKNNCIKYQKVTRTNVPVEINCLSAADFKFQDDEDIIYFYNPFNEEVTESFVNSIQDSLNRKRRKITIITHKWPAITILKKRLKPTKEYSYSFWEKNFEIYHINF
jgi:SAM-dependent methyltransferase